MLTRSKLSKNVGICENYISNFHNTATLCLAAVHILFIQMFTSAPKIIGTFLFVFTRMVLRAKNMVVWHFFVERFGVFSYEHELFMQESELSPSVWVDGKGSCSFKASDKLNETKGFAWRSKIKNLINPHHVNSPLHVKITANIINLAGSTQDISLVYSPPQLSFIHFYCD